MPGQLNKTYPWPYYEALTMEEAMNELTLLTFGIYGHPLNKQNGAPIRIIIPWKYGFKGIKSIVKIEFKKRQPRTFWDEFSREYGFYGNINPEFDHPRWSQASEIFLNTKERIPTQIYNGYGEFVGQMYDQDGQDPAAEQRKVRRVLTPLSQKSPQHEWRSIKKLPACEKVTEHAPGHGHHELP